jgi:glycosyltransferase involved in cell wall biosynthesis
MSTYALGLLGSKISTEFNCRNIRPHVFRKDLCSGLWRKIMNLLNGLALMFILLKTLILWHPRIVHIQTNSGAGFYEKSVLLMLSRLFFSKTVLHVHGGGFRDFYDRSSRLGKWVIRRCTTLATHLIVASSRMQETFAMIGTPARKTTLVRNAITLPKNREPTDIIKQTNDNAEPNRVVVLFLNRVLIAKGVLDLISAVGNLRESRPALAVRIVGTESADHAEVVRHIQDVGVGEQVEIVGRVSDEQKDLEYRNADIYVLPSHVEDFPYGILEAGSYGLPCIASAVGGIPNLISDGENGLLITPKDVAELSEALERLAKDTPLRQQLGLEIRSAIERGFSWDSSANRIGKVYNDLMGLGT